MERILIIEDEEKLLKSLEDFFRTQGYETVTAATGEAGIDLARKKRPAVVILDVMLPDISGYDICRCLKKEIPTIRVLMLSARGEEADKVHGLELGADDYMTKPFGSGNCWPGSKFSPGEEKRRRRGGDGTPSETSRSIWTVSRSFEMGREGA